MTLLDKKTADKISKNCSIVFDEVKLLTKRYSI